MLGLPQFSTGQWFLAVLAALSVGLAKSGLSGIGLITVLLMAEIMPARESTGAVLPLLICGDLLAVATYHRHAQWRWIARMLPPALAGIVAGYFLMEQKIPDRAFRALIGAIILALVALQFLREVRPAIFEHMPHRTWFVWLVGLCAGVTTMLANAAGPIMTLYFLAVNLPKWEFVGTAAMFFLFINVLKVPFSAHLGLINTVSLSFNAVLIPAVALGLVLGRKLIAAVSQKVFDRIVLIFAAIAAARLIVQSL